MLSNLAKRFSHCNKLPLEHLSTDPNPLKIPQNSLKLGEGWGNVITSQYEPVVGGVEGNGNNDTGNILSRLVGKKRSGDSAPVNQRHFRALE